MDGKKDAPALLLISIFTARMLGLEGLAIKVGM
jgi:hypothetical protein